MNAAKPVPAPGFAGRIRHAALGISARETLLSVRGFEGGTPSCRQGLEAAGGHFVIGYNLALQCRGAADLVGQLDTIEPALRGFAYEGAGMGVMTRKSLAPWSAIVDDFLRLADRHIYMVHIGMGWAMAVLPFYTTRSLRRMHPLYRWLAADGWGFHNGYFHPQRTLHHHRRPRRLTGYALRAYDQGVGRVAWFACCGQVEPVIALLAAFDPVRAVDLWAGVGLACTYAGGVSIAEIHRLLHAAGPHASSMRQGICFAATARHRAGNALPHTHEVCRGVLDQDLASVAQIAYNAEPTLEEGESSSSFELWRERIRTALDAK